MGGEKDMAAAGAGEKGAGAVSGAPALEARGLTCGWDERADVVRGIDLRVDCGETVCVVGRSGCGKTTLLHALSGLTLPRAGRVLLHGEDLAGRPGRVSYMLQKDLLLPSRTILDNAILPLVLAGEKKASARERAMPLMERFGLAGCEDKWPSELSGGMRQRAAFLRTYLMGNDVALLDEPFSALDALTRVDLRRWYCEMASELGIASVVITHDVDEAVSMASRVYVLEGDPRGGVPSRVAGEVVVDHAAGGGEPFELTDEFLRAKREVMALLG
ncbi:MAG: ABC transporter ATP-binding protein [Coriobacteriia bacterium]|nr:ABC transporter ATP-binding protein [Coriobacteriia bacterium]